MSMTDRIIRDVHAGLMERHQDMNPRELLDRLAWEIGAAASELVKPVKWVGSGMVAAGLCANGSEAHAKVARIISQKTAFLHLESGRDMFDEKDAKSRIMAQRIVNVMRGEEVDAVGPKERKLDADIRHSSLPIHARLESCPLDELAKAPQTIIEMAMEHEDVDLIEDVIVSLLVFAENWALPEWHDERSRNVSGRAL